MKLSEFLEKSWDRYIQLTPDAPRVHQWLEERGENVVNDHIAYRTFNLPGMQRLELGRVFEDWGYKKAPEDLDFPEKKLKASYYLHADPTLPKVFISELLLEKCSKELQAWIQSTVGKPSQKSWKPQQFLTQSWGPIQFADYQKFYTESEYAAWTAAFGVQLNHFTVLVNSLKTFKTLQDLNAFFLTKGLKLNEAGGVIKGTPQELLEQSSTIAQKVPSKFSGNQTEKIMGCYYEFARRYPIPGSQQLFSGFIPKSADKIFESTFERK